MKTTTAMSIEKAVKKALRKEQEKRERNHDFHEKHGLFKKMKDNGLLKQEGYGIAPLDTVGKRRYELLKPHKYYDDHDFRY